jgi:hypothetical protein
VCFVLVLEPLVHLPDFAVPVGADAEDRSEERAVYQRDGQSDPEAMESHMLAECQPDSEWDTFGRSGG